MENPNNKKVNNIKPTILNSKQSDNIIPLVYAKFDKEFLCKSYIRLNNEPYMPENNNNDDNINISSKDEKTEIDSSINTNLRNKSKTIEELIYSIFLLYGTNAIEMINKHKVTIENLLTVASFLSLNNVSNIPFQVLANDYDIIDIIIGTYIENINNKEWIDIPITIKIRLSTINNKETLYKNAKLMNLLPAVVYKDKLENLKNNQSIQNDNSELLNCETDNINNVLVFETSLSNSIISIQRILSFNSLTIQIFTPSLYDSSIHEPLYEKERKEYDQKKELLKSQIDKTFMEKIHNQELKKKELLAKQSKSSSSLLECEPKPLLQTMNKTVDYLNSD